MITRLAPFVLCAAMTLFQSVRADPQEAVVGSADFEKAKTDYLAKEKEIADSIAEPAAAARKRYEDLLSMSVEKIQSGVKPQEALPMQAELKRFQKEGLSSVPGKQPAPITKAWKALVDEDARLQATVAKKRAEVRGGYLATLGELQKAAVAAKQDADLKAIPVMRAVAITRTAIETNQLTATGPDNQLAPLTDLAREGGYLIGLEAGPGSFHNTDVVGYIRPVYMTAEGQQQGASQFGEGHQNAVVTARDGYAVGGVNVKEFGAQNIGFVVGSLQLVFMKINPDGVSLNPADLYTSEWFGGGIGGKVREFNAKGKLVTGLRCRRGEVVDSIAILSLK
ncbi:MAG: serine protease [Akkermansiaceae bacterium]|nr:serine protease [Akkermansiaceae bacterium]